MGVSTIRLPQRQLFQQQHLELLRTQPLPAMRLVPNTQQLRLSNMRSQLSHMQRRSKLPWLLSQRMHTLHQPL